MLVDSDADLYNLLLDEDKTKFAPFTIMMEIGLLSEKNARQLLLAHRKVSSVITFRDSKKD